LEAELDRQLDGPSLDPLQWRVTLLVLGTLMLEGIDIQVLGFAAPSMIAQWGLPRGSLGPAMAAALIGMAVGSPLGGRLGDRLGRRPVLICGTALFGLLTLVTAFAASLGDLAILRLGAGLGFGAALSNAPTLVAEWMPTRRRNQITTWAVLGVPIGGMLGAAVASWLIPAWGWRAAFMAAGALPVVLALIMMHALPESPRYLAIKSAHRANQPATESPFAPAYWRSTLGVNIAFFASLTVSYAFFSWTPTLLSSVGLSVRTALHGALVFNLLGTIGAVASTPVISRIGSRAGLLALSSLGVVSACAMIGGLQSFDASVATTGASGALLLGIGFLGVATVAGQVALFGLALHMYPTGCRATGLGIAGSTGRFGGILSAFAGGAVLGLTNGAATFMALIAALFVLCGTGVAIVNRHVPRTEPALTPFAVK
jgi:AAHS family 4-hydroxybenzoate transporter-like MFS transporter